MQNLAEEIIRLYDERYSADSNWRVLWQDCADYISPNKGDIVTKNTPGEVQTTQLFDSTAAEALEVFAAGLVSQIVPPGELWFRFSSKPGQDDAMASWLDACTHRAAAAIVSSNFYEIIHEDFFDAGRFGTSAIHIEENPDDDPEPFNFANIPVGTFTICENHKGRIDTVMRCVKFTARQAAQKFGVENLPDKMQKALDGEKQEERFEFIHCVRPRKDSKKGYAEAQFRPIAEYWVAKADKKVVLEGGHYEMPSIVSRLLRSNNEAWGRGPGTQALPEIKMVNRIEMDLLLAIEKMVDPPWLMPTTNNSYRPNNSRGGVTYYDPNLSNGQKPEQLRMDNRVDLGEQKTAQKRDRIRNAFYNSMFQMLSNPDAMRREKTAFEVAQMVQEKLVLFSPIFARITQEKLNPLLTRIFGILLRRQLLPPPPPGYSSINFDIDYVSKIALAIKSAQNNSLLQYAAFLTQIAPIQPEVMHLVDWKKAARVYGRNLAVPADFIRTDDEIEEIVSAQQQQVAEAQLPATVEQGSKAVKNLGPAAQSEVVKALK